MVTRVPDDPVSKGAILRAGLVLEGQALFLKELLEFQVRRKAIEVGTSSFFRHGFLGNNTKVRESTMVAGQFLIPQPKLIEPPMQRAPADAKLLGRFRAISPAGFQCFHDRLLR